MKRIIGKTIFLTLALLVCICLVSCAAGRKDGKKISVVCTVFPEYDWTRSIIGGDGNAELTLLIDNGVDLHNYQPSVGDLAKIGSCDIFIYVGGESDSWVKDALKTIDNRDMKVISLMELLGDRALEEETTEGMQEEEGGEEEEEIGYDEHIWLSLKNAEYLCNKIEAAISEKDPAGAEKYKNNCAAYCEKLSALGDEFKEFTDSIENKVLLVADRFPFRYLAYDYGIKYFAAFRGCSAETEASFDTIASLARKIDEYSLSHVIVTESSDFRIARTVIETSSKKDCDIIVMNSIQAVTRDQISNGASYIELMRENLGALKNALS